MTRWLVLVGCGLIMFAALIAVPPHSAVVSPDASRPSPRARFEAAVKLEGELRYEKWIFTPPVRELSNVDGGATAEYSSERLQVIEELRRD